MNKSDDLISRQAVKAKAHLFFGHSVVFESQIDVLPSADRPTIDCTEFMEWLKAEVLDEDNWELNAVANGEIICRKFRKLGWLDVEGGFYVDTRPTGEWIIVDTRPTGEWIIEDAHTEHCSVCGYAFYISALFAVGGNDEPNYCPNCGARMTSGEG